LLHIPIVFTCTCMLGLYACTRRPIEQSDSPGYNLVSRVCSQVTTHESLTFKNQPTRAVGPRRLRIRSSCCRAGGSKAVCRGIWLHSSNRYGPIQDRSSHYRTKFAGLACAVLFTNCGDLDERCILVEKSRVSCR